MSLNKAKTMGFEGQGDEGQRTLLTPFTSQALQFPPFAVKPRIFVVVLLAPIVSFFLGLDFEFVVSWEELHKAQGSAAVCQYYLAVHKPGGKLSGKRACLDQSIVSG